jgi:hypothetical protein
MENHGACGLDCGKCPAYISWKNNDDTLREETAKEWSIKYQHTFTKEMINCVGCMKQGCHGGYCSMCPLRACSLQKKLSGCKDCQEIIACQMVKDFEKQTGLTIFPTKE